MKFNTIVAITVLLLAFASPSLATEQVFFYHTDPAGTPLVMTDDKDNVVWTADYKPFGEEYAVTGTANNSKRFVGKEKDEETGLSYFGARYEDARTGRFTSVDPVRVVDPMTSKTNEKLLLNPQRLNVYAYALNNPYRYVDPDGREPLLNDVMSRVVSSEPFIRFGEAIGASNLNAALTGYDFRGNEFSGFERAGQLGLALIAAPVALEKAASGELQLLNKSLASRAQMGEVGTTIAGSGTSKVFRDAPRIANQYGGSATDWVKKSSTSYTARDSSPFETHWAENIKTGVRVEPKTIFPKGLSK